MFPAKHFAMRGYYDYFLLLSPSEHIDEIVQQHKQYAAKIIGPYSSEHSKAHISLDQMIRQKSFIAHPVMEQLKKGMRSLPPIELTVDGFDYFNSGGDDFKTIFAKLRSDHNTTLWFKQVKKFMPHKRFSVPHITICRNIPTADFELLWPYFKAINWVENFTVAELTILQRETLDSFAKWEPHLTLPFEARNLNHPIPPKAPVKKPKNNTQDGQMSLF